MVSVFGAAAVAARKGVVAVQQVGGHFHRLPEQAGEGAVCRFPDVVIREQAEQGSIGVDFGGGFALAVFIIVRAVCDRDDTTAIFYRHSVKGNVAGESSARILARYPPDITAAFRSDAGVQRGAVFHSADVHIPRHAADILVAADAAGGVAVFHPAAHIHMPHYAADPFVAKDVDGAVAVFHCAVDKPRHATDAAAAAATADAAGAVAVFHCAADKPRHAADILFPLDIHAHNTQIFHRCAVVNIAKQPDVTEVRVIDIQPGDYMFTAVKAAHKGRSDGRADGRPAASGGIPGKVDIVHQQEMHLCRRTCSKHHFFQLARIHKRGDLRKLGGGGNLQRVALVSRADHPCHRKGRAEKAEDRLLHTACKGIAPARRCLKHMEADFARIGFRFPVHRHGDGFTAHGDLHRFGQNGRLPPLKADALGKLGKGGDYAALRFAHRHGDLRGLYPVRKGNPLGLGGEDVCPRNSAVIVRLCRPCHRDRHGDLRNAVTACIGRRFRWLVVLSGRLLRIGGGGEGFAVSLRFVGIPFVSLRSAGSPICGIGFVLL